MAALAAAVAARVARANAVRAASFPSCMTALGGVGWRGGPDSWLQARVLARPRRTKASSSVANACVHAGSSCAKPGSSPGGWPSWSSTSLSGNLSVRASVVVRARASYTAVPRSVPWRVQHATTKFTISTCTHQKQQACNELPPIGA